MQPTTRLEAGAAPDASAANMNEAAIISDGVAAAAPSIAIVTPVSADAALAPRPRRRMLWRGGAVAAIVLGGATALLFMRGNHSVHGSSSTDPNAASQAGSHSALEIPVNTVHPRPKTLERVLEQPGSIQPSAEAELFAKASGYLERIGREATPELVAQLVGQGGLAGAPVGGAAGIGAILHGDLWNGPEKDIGSRVYAGEVLFEIATPDRQQDVVEKRSLVLQRMAELEAARAAVTTAEAGLSVAKALKTQALADIRKSEFEHIYHVGELARLKELAESDAVTPQVVDEKQSQVNAAQAALESSRAKLVSADAQLAVASAKLAEATADVSVKELLVQVARDALRQAAILADFGKVRAPFDGIITHRNVDRGDFIQNATSGQSRPLMTVAAIDSVKVVIHVPERDSPWVHVGSECRVTMDGLLGKEFVGRIARIAHALDSETRTMRAEIDLQNTDKQIQPGMYGQVLLTLQKIPNAMSLPASALYSRKGGNFIILVQDGVAHRQPVRIRYDDGREVEVVKLIDGGEYPLHDSEEVVVSNKGEIADGQRVRTISVSGK